MEVFWLRLQILLYNAVTLEFPILSKNRVDDSRHPSCFPMILKKKCEGSNADYSHMNIRSHTSKITRKVKLLTFADNPNSPLNLLGCFPLAGIEDELLSDEEGARPRPAWFPMVPTFVLPGMTPNDEGIGPHGDGWSVVLEVGIPVERDGEGWLR